MVVVALGEPGSPVTCCAAQGNAMATAMATMASRNIQLPKYPFMVQSFPLVQVFCAARPLPNLITG
jgi:hypothetical protein